MHDHKYFIFQVKPEFEPANVNIDMEGRIPTKDELELFSQQLYRRVEYAVLGCNCGDVIRKRVVQE